MIVEDDLSDRPGDCRFEERRAYLEEARSQEGKFRLEQSLSHTIAYSLTS